MKLWIITRAGPIERDENAGHVVAAEGPTEVRLLAARDHRDEGEGPWLRADGSDIELLGDALPTITEPGIILTDCLTG